MPKSMIIYDYANRPTKIELPDKAVESIAVTILSGDETGTVRFEDGTCLPFDASDRRIHDFFDGGYIIKGGMIERWLNFVPRKNRTASYQRQEWAFDLMEEPDNAAY